MDQLIGLIVAWAPMIVILGLFFLFMSRKVREQNAFYREALAATRENTEAVRALTAELAERPHGTPPAPATSSPAS